MVLFGPWWWVFTKLLGWFWCASRLQNQGINWSDQACHVALILFYSLLWPQLILCWIFFPSNLDPNSTCPSVFTVISTSSLIHLSWLLPSLPAQSMENNDTYYFLIKYLSNISLFSIWGSQQNYGGRGEPCDREVKFVPASAAQGFVGSDHGWRPSTAHQAMLRWHPT